MAFPQFVSELRLKLFKETVMDPITGADFAYYIWKDEQGKKNCLH